jgi:hypothetical protein
MASVKKKPAEAAQEDTPRTVKRVELEGFAFDIKRGVNIAAFLASGRTERTTTPLPLPWDTMEVGDITTVPTDFWTGKRMPKRKNGYTQSWARGRIKAAFKSWRARKLKFGDKAMEGFYKGLTVAVRNGRDNAVDVLLTDTSSNPVVAFPGAKKK